MSILTKLLKNLLGFIGLESDKLQHAIENERIKFEESKDPIKEMKKILINKQNDLKTLCQKQKDLKTMINSKRIELDKENSNLNELITKFKELFTLTSEEITSRLEGNITQKELNEMTLKVLSEKINYNDLLTKTNISKKKIENYESLLNDLVNSDSIMEKSIKDAELKLIKFKGEIELLEVSTNTAEQLSKASQLLASISPGGREPDGSDKISQLTERAELKLIKFKGEIELLEVSTNTAEQLSKASQLLASISPGGREPDGSDKISQLTERAENKIIAHQSEVATNNESLAARRKEFTVANLDEAIVTSRMNNGGGIDAFLLESIGIKESTKSIPNNSSSETYIATIEKSGHEGNSSYKHSSFDGGESSSSSSEYSSY
jgi:hypothetical protein